VGDASRDDTPHHGTPRDDATRHDATAPGDMGPDNRWVVLAVLAAALLIVVIDVSVLHVASPAIAEDLRPSPTSLLWIIDVYPLVVAPLLVAAGTLGDRFGRKRLLLLGLIVFTAASAFAALAWSPGALIAARVAQGLGGALIMPSTMSLIRAVFPDRRERVKAISVWSAVLMVGGAAGPILGGFLVEHFTWHAVFLINVPILLAVLPFAVRLLPESRHSDPPPWDGPGVLVVAGGVLLFAFSIKEAAKHGVEPITVSTFALSVVLLGAFVRRQLRAERPLLDLRLFSRPAFAAAVGSVLLSMFALVGLELYFAQYLQLVLGFGPLQASIRLVPLMLASLAAAAFVGSLLHRFGPRVLIAGGLAVCAVGLLPLLALGPTDEPLLLTLPFVAIGVSLQGALIAANDTILSSVSADDAGQAAAIEETAYELGGGIGVAVLGAVGSAVYGASVAVPAALGGGAAAAADRSLTDAVSFAEGLGGAAREGLLTAARDAWLSGFHVAIVGSVVLVGAAAIASAVVIPGRHAADEPVPGPGAGSAA
jgi:DHA2 family multidrug resistance protein-like MFS transporter